MTQTATGVRTAIAVSTGVGQGTQSASVLRTSVTSGSGSGLGGFDGVVVTRVFYREANGSGVGTHAVTRRMTALRSAANTGAGSRGVALWVNGGRTLNDRLLLPPVSIRNARPKYRRR